LLLYALPSRQASARVSLWRKLKRLGAVQLKASAYVLLDNPTQYERFQWLATEVRAAGGEETLIRVAETDGMSQQRFRSWRLGRLEPARHGRKASCLRSRQCARGAPCDHFFFRATKTPWAILPA